MSTETLNHWTRSSDHAGAWKMGDVEGGRWIALPLRDTNFFALVRLDPGRILPADASLSTFMDQKEIGFVMCRNAAEAKVAGTLLAQDSGGTREAEALLGKMGFEEISQHYGRRWELRTIESFVTLFTKSDDDDRDVIMNTVAHDEQEIRSPFGIFHGTVSNPMARSGNALHAAAAFVNLLKKSNHLLTPLTEADWRAFSEGRMIEMIPFTRINPAVAKRFAISCLEDSFQRERGAYWAAVDTARSFKQLSPLEHLNDEVSSAVVAFLGPDSDIAAGLADVINSDRSLQHLLLAAAKGNEEALLLAEGDRVPAIGPH